MTIKSTKKPLSKILTVKQQEGFSIAHQNVILEDMNKKLFAVAEAHGILNGKIENLHEDVRKIHGEMNHGFAKVDIRLEKIETRLDKIENRLDAVEEVVVEILARLKGLELRIVKLESKCDILVLSTESVQVLKDRFNQLEKRIIALEAQSS